MLRAMWLGWVEPCFERNHRAAVPAKLFFQEEFPDLIAEEARRLWRAG